MDIASIENGHYLNDILQKWVLPQQKITKLSFVSIGNYKNEKWVWC